MCWPQQIKAYKNTPIRRKPFWEKLPTAAIDTLVFGPYWTRGESIPIHVLYVSLNKFAYPLILAGGGVEPSWCKLREPNPRLRTPPPGAPLKCVHTGTPSRCYCWRDESNKPVLDVWWPENKLQTSHWSNNHVWDSFELIQTLENSPKGAGSKWTMEVCACVCVWAPIQTNEPRGERVSGDAIDQTVN